MSTIPPGGAPPQQHQGYGPTIPARMPIPGNAEFLLWLAILVVIAIVAAFADSVGAHDWVVAATWITAAYLISRGVAKASRVLEH
jgi:hypothetical protein